MIADACPSQGLVHNKKQTRKYNAAKNLFISAEEDRFLPGFDIETFTMDREFVR